MYGYRRVIGDDEPGTGPAAGGRFGHEAGDECRLDAGRDDDRAARRDGQEPGDVGTAAPRRLGRRKSVKKNRTQGRRRKPPVLFMKTA